MKETEFMTLQASVGEEAIKKQKTHSFYPNTEKTIQGAISVAYTALMRGKGTSRILMIKSKKTDGRQWTEVARIYRDIERKNKKAVPMSEAEAKRRIILALEQTNLWREEYSSSFFLLPEEDKEEKNEKQDDIKALWSEIDSLKSMIARFETTITHFTNV